jgi:hypothetical protein
MALALMATTMPAFTTRHMIRHTIKLATTHTATSMGMATTTARMAIIITMHRPRAMAGRSRSPSC